MESNGSLNKYAHVPKGTIVMYYGLNDSFLMDGLCDGNNNTPDLRVSRFIKGAERFHPDSYLGSSFENEDYITLTKDYFPDHSHNITYNISNENYSHNHNFSISIGNHNQVHNHNLSNVSFQIWNNGIHDHGITIVNNLQTIDNNHTHTINNYHTHIYK